MEFRFRTTCTLAVDFEKGNNSAEHLSTTIKLEVSKNLDKTKYVDPDNMPTAAGTEVLTNTLVQGLVGNIHYAHQNGFRDSAEHLRYIIAELEKGFIENVEIKKG